MRARNFLSEWATTVLSLIRAQGVLARSDLIKMVKAEVFSFPMVVSDRKSEIINGAMAILVFSNSLGSPQTIGGAPVRDGTLNMNNTVYKALTDDN